jgi:hypothetical protein
MSRLRAITIPFTAGQTDAVDPKVLPDGVFAEVRNGRLPAPGSLRLRRGWRPLAKLAANTGLTYDAFDLFSFDRSLVAMVRESAAGRDQMQLAAYTNTQTARPWSVETEGVLSPATNVRPVGNVSDAFSAAQASAALTADGVYGVIMQRDATTTLYRVFKTATDQTIVFGTLTNGSRDRKVVSFGTTFAMVENTTTGLDLYTLDPAAATPTWTLVTTLAGIVNPTVFDALTARVAAPSFLHIVFGTAATTGYARYSTAGVQSGSTKTVVAAASLGVAIGTDDVLAHVMYQEAGNNVQLLTFNATSPYATTAGPTALFGGASIRTKNFSIAYDTAAALGPSYAGGLSASFNVVQGFIANAHGAPVERTHASTAHTSGVIARLRNRAVGLVRGDAVATGGTLTSLYAMTTQNLFVDDYGVAAIPTTGLSTPYAPGHSASTSAVLVLHPRALGLSPRMFDFNSTARRPAVSMGGRLYIASGMLNQYDGISVQDSGMLEPDFTGVAFSNGAGTIANGTYKYRAVMSWTDHTTNEQLSIVSGEITAIYAGADDTGTFTIAAPKTLQRFAGLAATSPRMELYRTEAGPGELFYFTAATNVDPSVDATVVVDTSPDATIIDNARLYTEGENGGISGVLDWTPAPPTAYVAAMRDRIIAASAGTAYQVSQAMLPDEAARFTQIGVSGPIAFAYRDGVDGTITAAMALDDTIVIATADHLYVSAGEGPNLAGIGEFTTPARLPTDIGVSDWRSVLETSEGLWFRGTSYNMYLLPRGAATPTEEKAFQSRLPTATLVGAGYDSTDDVAVWAASDGTTLVRQIDLQQWFSDTLPFTPVALVGHRGALYAVASDGVVWSHIDGVFGDGASGATAVALRVTAGQATPFGLAGQGRLAVVEILGEYRADATILAEISYDDGLTWTTLGSFSVTGLTVGAAFQRQFHPARQRGDRFRVRTTMTPTVSTTEGCRLAGLTLYFTMQSGPSRLDSAKRK